MINKVVNIVKYKADYYIKNVEKYKERTRLYRLAQKNKKEGIIDEIIIEPPIIKKELKKIIVSF